jgi:hypothetical protein
MDDSSLFFFFGECERFETSRLVPFSRAQMVGDRGDQSNFAGCVKVMRVDAIFASFSAIPTSRANA